ncbi:MAG: type II secretion system protein [Deltaproteobacteria bacterium]|nr:type II secretion system protein [Deltaproteobacteria bacterium]MBW1929305.1 type II secretion system protein [Deltaproteobacteria bacterium]MBW2024782.1 type II secretion system protein [Deltaproteobacteria bacterium]MBW2124921.1 type II secretion system protein [Deltaproteobacteria bacterium]RLB17204.1 MAG: hypothetical protein DRG63_04110 [Deltaproteobacteria bacterium]
MRGSRGFTLIELMVVIAILGVLVVSAFPAYQTFRRRATGAEAKTMAKQLVNAEIIYFLQHDRFFPGLNNSISVFHNDPPNKSEIKQVEDALKITLPVGHFLDFFISVDNSGNVFIQVISAKNFPIFRGGSKGIMYQIDNKGNVLGPFLI